MPRKITTANDIEGRNRDEEAGESEREPIRYIWTFSTRNVHGQKKKKSVTQ
jgi:hypothetical protein